MSKAAAPKITANKGMKVSFSHTPQAVVDNLTVKESNEGGGYTLDVLANDLGGGAKTLWAIYADMPLEPVVLDPPRGIVLDVGTLTILLKKAVEAAGRR